MAAAAVSSIRHPLSPPTSLPSPLPAITKKAHEIADRIFKNISGSFFVRQAADKLAMVKKEEHLIKESISNDSRRRAISHAYSYITAPLEFLKDSTLNPETKVSLPRSTYKFVVSTLSRIPFEFKKKLGSGAFSKVCLAQRSEDYFAVKNPSMKTAEEIDIFKNEASCLMSFKHKNILSVEAISPRRIYLEYEEGDSLGSSLTAEQVERYILDVVEGLNYLHKKGWIHKDLKAKNVLISNGRAKLCDFGFTNSKKEDRKIEGTPCCLAPEILNVPFSKASDIWALGALLFNVITGKKYIYENPCKEESPGDFYTRIKKITYNNPCDEQVLFKDSDENPGIKDLMEKRDPKGLIRAVIIRCLHGIPKERITIDGVKKELSPENPSEAIQMEDESETAKLMNLMLNEPLQNLSSHKDCCCALL